MKKEKSAKRRLTAGAVLAAGLLALLSGCGFRTDSRRIVRIGHNQSVNHPTHLALTAFQEMIGERLGDRFRVEVYPSELLGSQTDMVQLDPDRGHGLLCGQQRHSGDLQQGL